MITPFPPTTLFKDNSLNCMYGMVFRVSYLGVCFRKIAPTWEHRIFQVDGLIIGSSKDISPLGCCNHRFSDHISFPLYLFKQLCSQSSHRSTSQVLINCESWESKYNSPYSDIWVFMMRTCVPRVHNMSNYILCHHTSRGLSLQQGTRPHVSGFPLRGCAHSYKCQLCV